MMELNVRTAPYKVVVVDGKRYSVRNVFEWHEPRPDLDCLAPENRQNGAHGGAVLRCVNVDDEADTIFVPIDAGFSPFDLVARYQEISTRAEDVWPRTLEEKGEEETDFCNYVREVVKTLSHIVDEVEVGRWSLKEGRDALIGASKHGEFSPIDELMMLSTKGK